MSSQPDLPSPRPSGIRRLVDKFCNKFCTICKHNKWLLLSVAAILIIAINYSLSSIQNSLLGHPAGLILIDSPEVFSRERLVNDRFLQDAWLRGKLNTPSESKGISASLSNNKQHSAKIAVKSGNVKESPEKNSDESTVINTPNQQKLTVSAIEELRNQLAYREEVRAEIMENMLDDRHDIKGNTLYRLKFDSTLIPHKDSNLWALVIIRLRGNSQTSQTSQPSETGESPDSILYRDWYEYTQKELNDELAARTRGLWSGKMEWDEQLKFSSFLYKNTNTEDISLHKDQKILVHCNNQPIVPSTQLSQFANFVLAKYGWTGFGHFLAPNSGFSNAQNLRLQILKKAEIDLADNYKSWDSELKKTACKINSFFENCTQPKDMKNDYCADFRSARAPGNSGGAGVSGTQRPSPLLLGLLNDANKIWKQEMFFVEYAFSDYMRETYQKQLGQYINIEVKYCKNKACQISLSSLKDTGKTAFLHALEKDNQVYSYTATPKESTQQFFESASEQQTRNLLLSLAAQPQSLDLNSIFEYTLKNQRFMQQIKRQPLVVGFSSEVLKGSGFFKGLDNTSSPAPNQLSDNNITTGNASAQFGWLIGPKLDLSSNNRDSSRNFRHLPIQNALSALVSLPSWWRSAKLDVVTCWIPGNATEFRQDKNYEQLAEDLIQFCSKKLLPFYIKLPGNVTEIKRKLGYQVGHIPYIKNAGKSSDFYVGQPHTSLLIEGGDLWRSTVVTMGAQRSNRIEVMPNMKGIIAGFDTIKEPLQWTPSDSGAAPCYAKVEIIVWTSEDRTKEKNLARIFMTQDDYKRGHCIDKRNSMLQKASSDKPAAPGSDSQIKQRIDSIIRTKDISS